MKSSTAAWHTFGTPAFRARSTSHLQPTSRLDRRRTFSTARLCAPHSRPHLLRPPRRPRRTSWRCSGCYVQKELAGAPERSECNARLANSGKLTFPPGPNFLLVNHRFQPRSACFVVTRRSVTIGHATQAAAAGARPALARSEEAVVLCRGTRACALDPRWFGCPPCESCRAAPSA